MRQLNSCKYASRENAQRSDSFLDESNQLSCFWLFWGLAQSTAIRRLPAVLRVLASGKQGLRNEEIAFASGRSAIAAERRCVGRRNAFEGSGTGVVL